MNLPLRGLITPLATPLEVSDSAAPSLDVFALEKLIDHVIDGGVHGIFLLGSTGEFSSLGREMRQEIIRRCCAHVNGRVPVLASITDTAMAETLRLADTAVEAGADAVVLAAPYYFQHSQDDLLWYLERITPALALPLFLYNIPHLTKTSYSPETVRKAADLPGVIGLKDSTGDIKYLEQVLGLMCDRPGFTVLIGPEEMLADAMKRGAHGGVCGGSNLDPRLLVELYESLANGDARAEELQERVRQMGEALYHVGFHGSSYLRGLKASLALAGLCRPEPAPPHVPFSRDEYAELERRYRSLGR